MTLQKTKNRRVNKALALLATATSLSACPRPPRWSDPCAPFYEAGKIPPGAAPVCLSQAIGPFNDAVAVRADLTMAAELALDDRVRRSAVEVCERTLKTLTVRRTSSVRRETPGLAIDAAAHRSACEAIKEKISRQTYNNTHLELGDSKIAVAVFAEAPALDNVARGLGRGIDETILERGLQALEESELDAIEEKLRGRVQELLRGMPDDNG